MFGIGLQELIVLLVVLGMTVALPVIVIVGVVMLVRRSNRHTAMQNPNIDKCRDCGGMVSVHAHACPHCGCVRSSS